MQKDFDVPLGINGLPTERVEHDAKSSGPGINSSCEYFGDWFIGAGKMGAEYQANSGVGSIVQSLDYQP